MAQAGSLIWLVVGASLLAVVARVAIPPAAWLALTFLLHASRSMPAVPGPYVFGDGRLPVIPTKDGRIASAVCFDANFPEFIRQAAQGSADLLIVSVNDWKEVPRAGRGGLFCRGDRTLTVQVPGGGVRTLYARTGDLFAWLCVAGLVMALGIAAVAPGKLLAREFNARLPLHADLSK